MLSAEGNPGLESIMDILNGCGLEIVVRPKGADNPKMDESKFIKRSELKGVIDRAVLAALKKVAPIRAKSIKHRAPTPHKIVTRSSQKLNR